MNADVDLTGGRLRASNQVLSAVASHLSKNNNRNVGHYHLINASSVSCIDFTTCMTRAEAA